MIEQIEKWLEAIKQFFIDNQGNPLLYVGVFGIGLLFFTTVYNALNKDK